MTLPIRILLVDDHDILRKGLRYLMGAHPGYQVVGEAADGLTAVGLAAELRPDVILMDLELPQQNGVEATAGILHDWPQARILALTSYVDDALVAAAVEAGVCGYVTKTSSPEDLLVAIDQAHGGGTYFPASIQSQLDRQRGESRRLESLTPREQEVAGLLSQGLSNRELAERLHLSPRTVEIHISHMLEKLNLDNRTQIALLARKAGWSRD